MLKTTVRTLAAGALLCAVFAQAASAQSFPSRPITIVVPFSPGAIADSMMRLVSQKVSDSLGQQVLIENRPGAGGSVGAASVKSAAPDGHTLLQTNTGSQTVLPSLIAKLSYDAIKDFQPITLLCTFPSFLVVPAGIPAGSAAELVALAKSKPGGLSFGSQGVGTNGHLLGEMLKAKSGAPMQHVSYKGAAPAIVDLLAGRLDFLFVSYASVSAQVKEGKLRLLGMSSTGRLKAVPDVPTMAEAGFPGVELDFWFGLVAPAGTPEPVVARLNEEFAKAVRHPDIVRRLSEQGLQMTASTPAQFAALIAADTARLGKLVSGLGTTSN